MELRVKNIIKDEILESINIFKNLLNDISIIDKIDTVTHVLQDTSLKGGNIFFAGNGGSAADSQHLAAELVGRFRMERRAIRAQALTTDTSILTSIGNDYNFENIFKRQIEALGNKGDALFAMSTSGNSKNIINLIIECKKRKILTIGLTGKNNSEMAKLCDYLIQVPSKDTARIQEAHILIGHIICRNIEEGLFSKI